MRIHSLIVVVALLSLGCAEEGVRQQQMVPEVDADPMDPNAPGRGYGDAGATDSLAVVTPDVLPPSGPEAGLEAPVVVADTGAGADVLPGGADTGKADVLPLAGDAGAEVRPDGPQPVPAACAYPQVMATGSCAGTWPGSNPPIECLAGCRGYDLTTQTTVGQVETFGDALMCNSYLRVTELSGRIVVCVRGQSLCELYCPSAPKG